MTEQPKAWRQTGWAVWVGGREEKLISDADYASIRRDVFRDFRLYIGTTLDVFSHMAAGVFISAPAMAIWLHAISGGAVEIWKILGDGNFLAVVTGLIFGICLGRNRFSITYRRLFAERVRDACLISGDASIAIVPKFSLVPLAEGNR